MRADGTEEAAEGVEAVLESNSSRIVEQKHILLSVLLFLEEALQVIVLCRHVKKPAHNKCL